MDLPDTCFFQFFPSRWMAALFLEMIGSKIWKDPLLFFLSYHLLTWPSPCVWNITRSHSLLSGYHHLGPRVERLTEICFTLDNIHEKHCFSWRIIALRQCDDFCHTSTWICHRYTYVPPSSAPLPPPSPPHLSGCLRALALSVRPHASNLHRSSVLHMVIYMFQCYSPKSSHPHLLPLSPNVCSLHLCLLCCPACRIVIIIFLFCELCKGVIWLFSNGKLICPALLIDKNTCSPPTGYSATNPLLTFYAICV